MSKDQKKTGGQVKLSLPAMLALREVKAELRERPGWLQSVSSSVVIEFLVWNFLHRGADEGMTDFRPETRVGRPTFDYPTQVPGMQSGVRPNLLRKATGAPEAQLGLPSTGNSLDKPRTGL